MQYYIAGLLYISQNLTDNRIMCHHLTHFSLVSGEQAIRHMLDSAMRAAERCTNPADREAISKVVGDVRSMVDALNELKANGQVGRRHTLWRTDIQRLWRTGLQLACNVYGPLISDVYCPLISNI